MTALFMKPLAKMNGFSSFDGKDSCLSLSYGLQRNVSCKLYTRHYQRYSSDGSEGVLGVHVSWVESK